MISKRAPKTQTENTYTCPETQTDFSKLAPKLRRKTLKLVKNSDGNAINPVLDPPWILVSARTHNIYIYIYIYLVSKKTL